MNVTDVAMSHSTTTILSSFVNPVSYRNTVAYPFERGELAALLLVLAVGRLAGLRGASV
jgi:hypothetical protein